MSELLQVAAALRKLTDAQLRALILNRAVNSAPLRDFFDLAELITNPKSISAAISSLPRSMAAAMSSIAAGESVEPAALDRLMSVGLADSNGLYFSVAESFAGIKQGVRPAISAVEDSKYSEAAVASECGLTAFETMQALTELVFDLEQRFVREVGKGSVGLPDIKRLANHLRKPNEYAREIFNLARLAGLMSLVNGRWQLGPNAPDWLNSSGRNQVKMLWSVWLDSVGETAATELKLTLESQIQTRSIHNLFEHVYPFADSSVGSRIASLENLTGLIGLAGMGVAAPWFRQVISGNFDEALALIEAQLPAAGAKLICQADLSLIATGPLPISVEIDLRRFAEIEMIGMASTYRLTPLSLTHGLETGLTESKIRQLLEQLSGAKLPQPIDYLIKESVARFGRLTVLENPDGLGAQIASSDPILLTEILNNTELKAFALHREPEGAIGSRFEPEVIYFGLREAGYAAIRLNSKSQVISPLRIIAAAPNQEKSDSILEDVARMRAEEQKAGSELADDDIQRKIQLAIKNKARAEVTVLNNSGDEITFLLDPVGIANGRLRAKDKKADIERTLPIASIIRVSIK